MYYGYEPLFTPAQMITWTTDKNLNDEMQIETIVKYDLAKLTGRVHGAVQLALQRGYHNATSGKAFKVYCLLAAAFDFPVFCLGQGGYIILSFDKNSDEAVRNVKVIVEQARTLSKLANPKAYVSQPSFGSGHKAGWGSVYFTRPTALTDEGLCNLLDVRDVSELVPKENRMRALQALLGGEKLQINRRSTT